jgi:hypothetical protein
MYSILMKLPWQTGGNKVFARLPSKADVESVAVGKLAPNCFGSESIVTRISYIGNDIHGKRFVCYVTAMSERDTPGNGCGCSTSMKEGELIRTVALTGIYSSAQCDSLELEMRTNQ